MEPVLVTVTFGPKVRELAATILGMEALKLTDGDRNAAYDLVDSHPTLAKDAAKEAAHLVATLKTSIGCPHTDDEDIAQDILSHMDQSKLGPPSPDDPACPHCGFIH